MAIGLSIVIGALATAPMPAAARQRLPESASSDSSRTVTVSGHGLLYLDVGRFYDPGSESVWAMADAAFGGGASLYTELGEGFWLGAEGTLARTRYERVAGGSSMIASGTATISTLLLNGRLSGNGLGQIGRMVGLPFIGNIGYVNGGAGIISYRLEDLRDTNVDLLLSVGGGLEIMFSGGRRGIYVEIKRFWAFHEREGVESGTSRHTRLDLGVRAAFR